jgi:hypothetical protein
MANIPSIMEVPRPRRHAQVPDAGIRSVPAGTLASTDAVLLSSQAERVRSADMSPMARSPRAEAPGSSVPEGTLGPMKALSDEPRGNSRFFSPKIFLQEH